MAMTLEPKRMEVRDIYFWPIFQAHVSGNSPPNYGLNNCTVSTSIEWDPEIRIEVSAIAPIHINISGCFHRLLKGETRLLRQHLCHFG